MKRGYGFPEKSSNGIVYLQGTFGTKLTGRLLHLILAPMPKNLQQALSLFSFIRELEDECSCQADFFFFNAFLAYIHTLVFCKGFFFFLPHLCQVSDWLLKLFRLWLDLA